MVTSLAFGRPHGSGVPTPGSSADSSAGLTTTAWAPRLELTVADWIRQGRWLGALGRGSGWWIGDWVRYGSARYGDRYRPAAQATGYDVQSLRNMAYVAGRFDVPRRREGLSFSHHAVLASLPVEDQDLWLDRAEAGALSVGSLRCELRRTRQRAAARAARAETRRQRDGGVPEPRPKAESRGRGVQPRTSAHPTTVLGGSGSGFQPMDAEVECPECGHHFAPSTGQAAPLDGPSPIAARRTSGEPPTSVASPQWTTRRCENLPTRHPGSSSPRT